MRWFNILAMAVVLVVSVAASPTRVVARRIMAQGRIWDCFPTNNPAIFECLDGKGGRIYLTGDTESGCNPTGAEGLVCREPETQCYERVGGDHDFNDTVNYEDFFVVSCEDGTDEGDIDWLDELVEALQEH